MSWLFSKFRGQTTPSWPTILWREWRNCEDEEYAHYLFEVVVNEPTDWRAAVVLAVLGAVLGLLGETSFFLFLGVDVPAGAGIGALAGVLVWAGLRLARRSTWGAWLPGLVPLKLVTNKEGKFAIDTLYVGLALTPGSGMGVGLTGALFFGQPNPLFYVLLTGLIALVVVAGFFARRWQILGSGLLAGVIGWLFGLFFGLGFAQLVGLLITPLDVPNSARLVGLAVGVGAGLCLGRRAGLVGMLVIQFIAMAMVVPTGSNLVLLGWLTGLFAGGLVAAVGQMYLSTATPDLAGLYAYRLLYLWWARRPFATEVEAALRQHATGTVWSQLFRDLAPHQKRPASAEVLWAYLQKPSWTDHFISRHALVYLGGQAMPHLLTITNDWTHPLCQTARWLIHSISHETTTRLAGTSRQMMCPGCLTCCGSHPAIQRFGIYMTYYGCRTCGQSREFLYCPQGVTAVLDSGWRGKQPRRGGILHKLFGSSIDDSPQMVTQAHQNGHLRVNWLVRRHLFDFDRVEIIQATDEEVERFAVQSGNDTDPLRQPRYRQMPCYVALGCSLFENSLRVLDSIFGQIERGQEGVK